MGTKQSTMKSFILFATFYLTISMSHGKTVNVERFNVSNVERNNTHTFIFNPIESVVKAAVETISRISNLLNPSTEESTVTKTDSITFPANENAALFGATDDISIDLNLSTQELRVVENNSTEEDITTVNPWKPIVNNVSDNVTFADEKSNTNITEEKKVVENNSTEEKSVPGKTNITEEKKVTDNVIFTDVNNVSNKNISNDNVVVCEDKGERLDINQHSCCKYYTGMIETWLGNFEQYDYKCFHPKTREQVEDPLDRCVEKDYLLVCCDEAGKCTGYNGPHLTDPLCFYYEGSQACAK